MNKVRRWIITGGHHNSALVLAQALQQASQTVIWYGHLHAAEQDTSRSAESIEVEAAGIMFRELQAGKSGRGLWRTLIGGLRGVLQARQFLRQDRPDVIVSFGGYLGFATALAGASLGIPIFIHEQTVIAGQANRLVAYLARKVYLTFSSSRIYFPRHIPTRVVGLPLRPSLLRQRPRPIFPNGLPTLLILGGKQGSHLLNTKLFAHLPELLSRYNLVHQTGQNTQFNDYEQALAHQNTLPLALADRYRPVPYLSEAELAKHLVSADLVIGRSGAHTTYELAVLGQKSVLIPFPHTYGQEQVKNARFLESQGLATIIPESELTFPKLQRQITQMLRLRRVTKVDLPQNAAQQMILDMSEVLGD